MIQCALNKSGSIFMSIVQSFICLKSGLSDELMYQFRLTDIPTTFSQLGFALYSKNISQQLRNRLDFFHGGLFESGLYGKLMREYGLNNLLFNSDKNYLCMVKFDQRQEEDPSTVSLDLKSIGVMLQFLLLSQLISLISLFFERFEINKLTAMKQLVCKSCF